MNKLLLFFIFVIITHILSALSHPEMIEIPEGVASIGGSFLQNCNQFTGPLIIRQNHINRMISGMFTLSTDSSAFPMYTEGVQITGLSESEFIQFQTRFPDRNTNPFRKTIHIPSLA